MRLKRWQIAAALLLGATAARAEDLFMQALTMPAPRFERPAKPFTIAVALPDMGDIVRERIAHVQLASFQRVALSAAPSQQINVAPLLNRHLKTNLNFTLGGASIWVSGSFDRAQKAYVSVLVDGKDARFFNVEELVKKPETMGIGSNQYKLSVSPDLSDLLESEIRLTNVADKKDQQRITLREMLTAVSGAGEDARVGGDPYKVFYYDDLKAGRLDSSSRSFAFIKTDSKGEFHVFLVPAELVPSDKIAIFKMHENKSVGLQMAGTTLRLFDNP